MTSFPELRGHIFYDPNFIDNYLAVDPVRLKAALDLCAAELDAFQFPEATREAEFHEPIALVINTIKQATETDPEESYPLPYADVYSEPIPSHEEDTDGIRPYQVMFETNIRHWQAVRMTIEVKAKATYLKVGMKKLAGYAHMMFANQMERRHVYGLVICSWAATFVRFDRSGGLYSKPIDMRDQREEFRTAFAGLMLLDEEAIGYDTAFTGRIADDGYTEYYLDLPLSAFSSEGVDVTMQSSQEMPVLDQIMDEPPDPSTIRMKVIHSVRNRASIFGPGTIVLLVRQAMRPGFSDELAYDEKYLNEPIRTTHEQRLAEGLEVLGTRDYMLRIGWRDPDHTIEGEVLERLVGEYGVEQYMWHSDVFKECDSPDCMGCMVSSCGECLDRTPHRVNVGIIKNLTDLDVDIPKEIEGEGGIKYDEIKTEEYSPASVICISLVYSQLLMSTIGSPLYMAPGPRELLQPIPRCGSCDGNVMILKVGRGYNQRNWKLPQPSITDEDLDAVSEDLVGPANSERIRQMMLDQLGRDPVGMLGGFELAATHGLTGAKFFDDSFSESKPDAGGHRSKQRRLNLEDITFSSPLSSDDEDGEAVMASEADSDRFSKTEADAGRDFRTGTPEFLSVRILNMEIGQRYKHHFMDDLESFFWLILWCVVDHLDVTGGQRTNTARELLRKLSDPDFRAIALQKSCVLVFCSKGEARMKEMLTACNNSWANNPAIVSLILKLGSCFTHFNNECFSMWYNCPEETFPTQMLNSIDALMRREAEYWYHRSCLPEHRSCTQDDRNATAELVESLPAAIAPRAYIETRLNSLHGIDSSNITTHETATIAQIRADALKLSLPEMQSSLSTMMKAFHGLKQLKAKWSYHPSMHGGSPAGSPRPSQEAGN